MTDSKIKRSELIKNVVYESLIHLRDNEEDLEAIQAREAAQSFILALVEAGDAGADVQDFYPLAEMIFYAYHDLQPAKRAVAEFADVFIQHNLRMPTPELRRYGTYSMFKAAGVDLPITRKEDLEPFECSQRRTAIYFNANYLVERCGVNMYRNDEPAHDGEVECACSIVADLLNEAELRNAHGKEYTYALVKRIVVEKRKSERERKAR